MIPIDGGVLDEPSRPRPNLVPDDRKSVSLAFVLRFLSAYWRSAARWPGLVLAGLLAALSVIMPQIGVVQSANAKKMTDATVALDASSMMHFTWVLAGLGLFAILLIVAQSVVGLALKMIWRVWSSDNLIRRWLGDHAFQRIERDATVENADQRIAEDIQLGIDGTVTLTLGFVGSLIGLATYVPVLWAKSGSRPLSFLGADFLVPGFLVWVAIIASVLGYLTTLLVGRGLVRINVVQQRYEAGFRYDLVRTRENAEQIAFYRGGQFETTRLANGLLLIQRNYWRLIGRQGALELNGNIFQTIVHGTVPALLFIPKIADGTATPGDLAQVTAVYMMTIIPMTWFMNVYDQIAKLISVFRRLETLDEEIRNVTPSAIAINDAPALATSALHLSRPDGERLTEVEPLAFSPGDRLLIRGPSGVGKSTFLRAIAGLWPYGKGEVAYPAEAVEAATPLQRVMFLPQRSYLPTGSLRGVLSYPAPAGDWDDAAYADALDTFGLGQHVGSLDTEQPWHQRLSPGEQQRIAAARVLLQRPDVLILDEATSALDQRNEQLFYETLIDRLPGLILVSVSHGTDVERYHTRAITLHPAQQR